MQAVLGGRPRSNRKKANQSRLRSYKPIIGHDNKRSNSIYLLHFLQRKPLTT